jgi:RimJ/RimL family protein N-acetyltransferase
MATIEPVRLTLPDGTPLLVRSPTGDDAPEILAFRRVESATTDQVLTQPHECPETADEQWESMKDAISHPDRLFLVACIDQRIRGLLSFAGGKRERERHAGVFGLTIAEAWRGRGIGTALISTLLDWARAHPHIEKVSLVVFSTNDRAIRLYRALGFEEEGRQFGHTQITPGSYVDNLHMARWVKPRSKP